MCCPSAVIGAQFMAPINEGCNGQLRRHLNAIAKDILLLEHCFATKLATYTLGQIGCYWG